MNICDNSLFIYPDTVFRRQMEQVLPHRYSGVILAGCYIHLHYICLLFPYTHQCLKQKKKSDSSLIFHIYYTNRKMYVNMDDLEVWPLGAYLDMTSGQAWVGIPAHTHKRKSQVCWSTGTDIHHYLWHTHQCLKYATAHVKMI